MINTEFKMSFKEKADTAKALEAFRQVISNIDYTDGNGALWIQSLSDNRTDKGFEIESDLWCDEFSQYIPAMIKAVAEVLPTSSFEGSANYNSLQCFCVDEYEFSLSNRKLHIKETFMDDNCGYFCPDCGCFVAYLDQTFDTEEIECEDCEKPYKVTDLKYVPPTLNEETIEF